MEGKMPRVCTIDKMFGYHQVPGVLRPDHLHHPIQTLLPLQAVHGDQVGKSHPLQGHR